MMAVGLVVHLEAGYVIRCTGGEIRYYGIKDPWKMPDEELKATVLPVVSKRTNCSCIHGVRKRRQLERVKADIYRQQTAIRLRIHQSLSKFRNHKETKNQDVMGYYSKYAHNNKQANHKYWSSPKDDHATPPFVSPYTP
jgi:hypothetical protein